MLEKLTELILAWNASGLSLRSSSSAKVCEQRWAPSKAETLRLTEDTWATGSTSEKRPSSTCPSSGTFSHGFWAHIEPVPIEEGGIFDHSTLVIGLEGTHADTRCEWIGTVIEVSCSDAIDDCRKDRGRSAAEAASNTWADFWLSA